MARFYTSASKTAPPTALPGCFLVDIECNILHGDLCEVHPPLPFFAVVVISVRRLCPSLLRVEKGGDPEVVRESQRRRKPVDPLSGIEADTTLWPSPPPTSTSCLPSPCC